MKKIQGSTRLINDCPFCGGNNIKFRLHYFLFYVKYSIVCNDCAFETKKYSLPFEAIKEFNKIMQEVRK